jgi:hypothetical protein
MKKLILISSLISLSIFSFSQKITRVFNNRTAYDSMRCFVNFRNL